jgi:KaiC/GvpD/RAD55 family RecA-like ATPase
MSGFNWPLKKILKEKKLHITRAELYDFEKFKILIEEKVEEFKMKRLVIDPITVLSLFSERPLEIRRSFLELDKLSKKLKCTSLFTCEIPEGVEAISSFGIEEFVADGIIFLYRVPCRALNIIKMRSIAHDENIRPLTISRLGIKVNPNKHAFTPFKVK